MIPKHLTNPFLQSVAGDTWTAPGGAVSDLYAGVVDVFKRSVEAVQVNGNSSGLLVLGEAGAGKTHLISQLRQDYLTDPNVFLVSIPLETHPGRVWRYVRERFVGDLLKRKWSPAAPGLTGLLRILMNRFPDWNPLSKTGGIMGSLLGPNHEKELRDHLSDFADECELAAGVKRVLPKLWNSDTAELAADWLKGQPLTEDDLKKLQLPPTLLIDPDLEDQSREVVLSLCRLAGVIGKAGKATTLLICFDQLEGFAGSTQDPAGLKSFTIISNQLLEVAGPRLIATFMRPTFHAETFTKNVDIAYQARIAQQAIPFPIITWEQVVRVVLTRLAANPACKAERLSHQNNSYWPFSEQELREMLTRHGQELTPRSVIRDCAGRFNALLAGSGSPPKPPPVIPPPSATLAGTGADKKLATKPTAVGQKSLVPPQSPPPPPSSPQPPQKDDIAELWAKRRDKHAKSLKAIKFDDVFGGGLPWLREVLGLTFSIADLDRRLPDVNLLFDSNRGQHRTGVAFCNQVPRSLWPRLKRLVEQQKSGQAGKYLDRLILLRSKSEPLSDTANGYIDTMKAGGAVILLITDSQLAQFAAYHELVTKARNGDITRNGLPISDLEYNTWARRHLTPEIRQLAEAVFGPLPTADPPPSNPQVAAKVNDHTSASIHLEFA